MENRSPEQLQVLAAITGYTRAVITHTASVDYDYVGLVIYKKVGLAAETYSTLPNIPGRTYFSLGSLVADTTITAGHYDALSDDPVLLENKIGINLPAPLAIDLKEEPVVIGVTVSSESVDIGTIPSEFIVTMSGYATDVIIQIKKVADVEWVTKYNGPFQSEVNLGTVGVEEYNVRVKGRITLPDNSLDEGSFNEWGNTIDVTSSTGAPDAPTGLVFTMLKKTVPIDTYDVKVEWDWAKGTGSAAKAFLVEWNIHLDTEINTATTTGTSYIISNIPYNLLHTIKVIAVPYSGDNSASLSAFCRVNDTQSLRVPNTMLKADFSQDTDIQIGYRYLRAFAALETGRTQTFEIDAETGSMAIGAPSFSYGGLPPILVDGATGTMSINGRVIADTINAATIELSWLGDATPQIRTANKGSYADTSEGMWMGYRADGDFAFNLGGNTSYLKFADGKLKIAADVEIFGSGALGSYSETRYIASGSAPDTPTLRNPPGWTITVPTKLESESIYQVVARINADETLNVTWSVPSSLPGGSSGASGTNAFVHIAYADDAIGTNASQSPIGKDYIGIYSSSVSTPEPYTGPSWEWQLARGDKGTAGVNGYVHIAYADDDIGTGFVQTNPGTKKYIGTYTDSTEADAVSTSPLWNWQLVKGTDGTAGINSYLHIAYADDDSGTGGSQSPLGKEYIGTYSDSNVSAAAYNSVLWNWQLAKGSDGTAGVNGYMHIAYADDDIGTGFVQTNPGTKKYIGTYSDDVQADAISSSNLWNWQLVKGTDGEAGVSSYLHIAYADDDSGTGGSQSPLGKDYIGTYSDSNVNAAGYTSVLWNWQLAKGSNGTSGTSGYAHIAYADDANGGGFVQTNPGTKKYIGTYTDSTEADAIATSPLWNWQLVKGTDGTPGVSSYLHIAYADDASGTNGSESPIGKDYIGTYSDSNVSGAAYTSNLWNWQLARGDKGTAGVNGYSHVAYASDANGGGFTQTNPSAKDFLGTYTDNIEADAPATSDLWNWQLVKGNKGNTGNTGSQGISAYLHIAYADNNSGGGFSYVGDGKAYIGTANTTTPQSPEAVSPLWSWQLFKGNNGESGAGFFRWPITGFTTWSAAHADTGMTNWRGGNSATSAVIGDVLTLYNSTNPSVADTMMWSGSAWTSPALLVHGDMVLDGTVRASKIIADNAVFSSAGIDVIYNSGGNSSNYTMKVDLLAGEIHIK